MLHWVGRAPCQLVAGLVTISNSRVVYVSYTNGVRTLYPQLVKHFASIYYINSLDYLSNLSPRLGDRQQRLGSHQGCIRESSSHIANHAIYRNSYECRFNHSKFFVVVWSLHCKPVTFQAFHTQVSSAQIHLSKGNPATTSYPSRKNKPSFTHYLGQHQNRSLTHITEARSNISPLLSIHLPW